MRLLAFSDLHRDRDRARRLVTMSAQADVVIGAGDFASMRLGLNGIVDALRGIAVPALLVPGNNESDAALWRACAGWGAARVLHGEGAEIEGVSFYGLGAGVPKTPFPWSFDLDEQAAAERLAACPAGGVLIVHSPPHGYVDEAFGRHLGSRAILTAIERCAPALVVCGHIHQQRRRESRIGPSRVVNVGPEGMFFEGVTFGRAGFRCIAGGRGAGGGRPGRRGVSPGAGRRARSPSSGRPPRCPRRAARAATRSRRRATRRGGCPGRSGAGR
jgi:Icc-related predicted phosphoesterase